MKTSKAPAHLLALCALLFFSCGHWNSNKLSSGLPVKLKAFVYAVATHVDEMSLANKQALIQTGHHINLFVPYSVEGDEIRSARLSWIDAGTGEALKEIPLQPSTDLSVMNIKVPEELQGTRFLFASVPVEDDLAGHTVSIHSKIETQSKSVEDKLETAFRIQ